MHFSVLNGYFQMQDSKLADLARDPKTQSEVLSR